MNTKKLKELVKEYPAVWEATKLKHIHANTPVYKAGVKMRERLEALGFREVDDGEDLIKTLKEAEEFLTEKEK